MDVAATALPLDDEEEYVYEDALSECSEVQDAEQKYYENRLKDLDNGDQDSYPHKFAVSISVSEFIAKYKSLFNGDHVEDDQVSVAGRIMSKRSSSSKLSFYDLNDRKTKRGELSIFPRSFTVLSPCLHMLPSPANNRKQEIWSPGHLRHPERYLLKDQETRFRQRYLDLMMNNHEIPQIFKTVDNINKYIRRFLSLLDFVE
ncbi:hypothetical protein Bca52824_069845, partial [Brassica carinata]